MEWHINDLSLVGQFADPNAFRVALEPILQLRLRNEYLKSNLFCSRTLSQRPATSNEDMRQAIEALRDRTFKGLVLAWMSKAGPFWEDNRQHNEDDYFEYDGNDVTDQGLGEISRRKLYGTDARSFSFIGSRDSFGTTPLVIQHGLSEAPIEFIDINNYWNVGQLEFLLDSLNTTDSWHNVLNIIRGKFSRLIFSDEAIVELLPSPFSNFIFERILFLLDILNRVVIESDVGGKLTPRGEELLANYFAGFCGAKTPIFKPESSTNKRDFREKLTFRDPVNTSRFLFCHWHGKIQTPPIRIHFEWPRPEGQTEIKIAYIGPKITKD